MRSLRCAVVVLVLVFVFAILPGALANALTIDQVQPIDFGKQFDGFHDSGLIGFYEFESFNRVAGEGGFQGTLVGVTWYLSVDEIQLRATRPPIPSDQEQYGGLSGGFRVSGWVGLAGEMGSLDGASIVLNSWCDPALQCDFSVTDHPDTISSFAVTNISPYIAGPDWGWPAGSWTQTIGFGSWGNSVATWSGHVNGELTLRYTYDLVPEPSTLLLLGSGLAGVGGMAWRRKRKG